MPTVGSWCEFDVICSAITALIQCTKPCVGFWLCTPPTGIVPPAVDIADAADTDGMVDANVTTADEFASPFVPDDGLVTWLLLLTLVLLLLVSLLLWLLLLLFVCDEFNIVKLLSVPPQGNVAIPDF